ncbi:hypothetical protein BCV69DRAFT_284753 [Microstroma glucosiphilum]|uniref:Uncharacterized protein n=1 Tax=Pseudomicrostroma glucosiphilum TaxID=1684307 RepID=A0A316U011_9BASI|nr:hypothetical protein BCV69DRAFT_284753 [Pseudomicrostroma glucosiphilum]PWN18769.1 hypothetical protein BCV69DRAFT_284753 [Pseudomicrostroma glucosiphilum]
MNLRLVCRQSNGEERKVMLFASDFGMIISAAAERLDCTSDQIILQVKDGDELWEIEQNFWPSLSENQTLYAHAKPKKAKSGGKRKASANGSGFVSDSATSAGDDSLRRPAPRKRKSTSKSVPVGRNAAIAANNTPTGSNGSSAGPSASASVQVDNTQPSGDAWAPLQPTAISSSNRRWDAKADAILWDRLRKTVEKKPKSAYTVAERMAVFEEILGEHGTHGTVSRALAGRNASALNARAGKKIQAAVQMGFPLPYGLRELYVRPKNDPAQKSRSPSARQGGRESGGEGNAGANSARSTSRRDSFVIVDDSSAQSDGDDEDSDAAAPWQMSPHSRRSSRLPVGDDSTSSGTDLGSGDQRRFRDSRLQTPPLPTFAGSAASRKRWPAQSAAPSATSPQAIASTSLPLPPASLPPRPSQASDAPPPPQARSTRQQPPRRRPNGNAAIPPSPSNGALQASGSNATPLSSRTTAAVGQRAPPASTEPPLFLAEENARLTQAAQAAINPFLASRVVRESAAVPTPPPAESSVQQAVQAENRRHLTWPASSQGSAPQSASTSVKSEKTDEEDELDGSDAQESGEEASDTEERQVDAHLARGSDRLPSVNRPPLPFGLLKGASPADVDLLHMTLSEEWEETRQHARAIIRSSIPRKKSLEIGDIDFALAASKLVDFMEKQLDMSSPSGIRYSVPPRSHETWYAGLATSIALEVFGATPPDWSVRRTSFAVAGYYAALGDHHRRTFAKQKNNNVIRFMSFAQVSQKVFWALRSAEDGSRYLEAEAEDISAAVALVLNQNSVLGRHLADRLRWRPAEEMLPLVMRCKSYLNKLEASVKFVQRCPEAREWGAVQKVTRRMIPTRSCIRHWREIEPQRFTQAQDALFDLQKALDALQSQGMYDETPMAQPSAKKKSRPPPRRRASVQTGTNAVQLVKRE